MVGGTIMEMVSGMQQNDQRFTVFTLLVLWVGSHCSMITYAFCVMLHDGPHALNCNGFTVFTIWYDAHAGGCLFAAIESHFSAMHQCDNFMLDWGTVGRLHALV